MKMINMIRKMEKFKIYWIRTSFCLFFIWGIFLQSISESCLIITAWLSAFFTRGKCQTIIPWDKKLNKAGFFLLVLSLNDKCSHQYVRSTERWSSYLLPTRSLYYWWHIIYLKLHFKRNGMSCIVDLSSKRQLKHNPLKSCMIHFTSKSNRKKILLRNSSS